MIPNDKVWVTFFKPSDQLIEFYLLRPAVYRNLSDRIVAGGSTEPRQHGRKRAVLLRHLIRGTTHSDNVKYFQNVLTCSVQRLEMHQPSPRLFIWSQRQHKTCCISHGISSSHLRYKLPDINNVYGEIHTHTHKTPPQKKLLRMLAGASDSVWRWECK